MKKLVKTVKESLKANYRDPVGYRPYSQIITICDDYVKVINDYFYRFQNDPLAKSASLLIIYAAYHKIPCYWVDKELFDSIKDRPITDDQVSSMNPTIKEAFFILPSGVFLDDNGHSVDWILYKAIDSKEPIESIQYFDTTFGSAKFLSDRIIWTSVIKESGYSYVTQIDPKNYNYSINRIVEGSSKMDSQDSNIVRGLSNILINCLLYADSDQGIAPSPVGFTKKHTVKNASKVLMSPRWLKATKSYATRMYYKGGSHASPTEHTRKEHIRRYRDANGNVIREVRVKSTVVNKRNDK